ncbi:hypothetical protein ANN_23838 [Periplaneta americana]|uniref:Uncharacterized protein n=1 Tax=Periplaneta americana TaxID=6978 RepID=A0ABQ8SNE0_PERAM|nr:hypothetical protein ANN_23838 [Periplaneta americana]
MKSDELKANIREIRKITEDELIHVNDNFIKRCQKCVDSDDITSNSAYNKAYIRFCCEFEFFPEKSLLDFVELPRESTSASENSDLRNANSADIRKSPFAFFIPDVWIAVVLRWRTLNSYFIEDYANLSSRLQRVHNACVRYICNIRKYDHVSPSSQTLSWLRAYSESHRRHDSIDPSSSFVPIPLQRDVIVVHRSVIRKRRRFCIHSAPRMLLADRGEKGETLFGHEGCKQQPHGNAPEYLLGPKSKLSLENKLLVHKVILKPIWTYGIQLWGTASNSNIEILQRYQSKTLRSIATAP